MTLKEKINALVENDNFVASLENVETEEEFRAAFSKEGIELHSSEVASDELDENALEMVAGGGTTDTLLNHYWDIVYFCADAPKHAYVAFKAYYDYKRYGNMYRTYSAKTVDAAIKYWQSKRK